MTVISTRKLRKIGNSEVLKIPEEVIQALDVKEVQKITFKVKNEHEKIEKKHRKNDNSKEKTKPEDGRKDLDNKNVKKITLNLEKGQVRVEAGKTDNKEIDILRMADQVSNQYDNALKDLVNR